MQTFRSSSLLRTVICRARDPVLKLNFHLLFSPTTQASMSTMKAVVLQGDQKVEVVSDRPLPKPRPKYLGVQVKCVALNPTDWKHADHRNYPGLLSGCDYSGIVESVGEGCAKEWKKGDRICGMAHGGNKLQPEDGAFAEHIMVAGDVQFRMPDSMSFEEASTFGLGTLTVGQGMYQAMGLNLPNDPTSGKEPILIYGGSTASGTLGIQFAKLSGYTPITTCSPRNFDLVKSLGAAEAFDYNDPDCAAKIRKYTNDNLKLCWDTIALEGSAKLCCDVLASGGKYGVLLYVEAPRDDIQKTHTLAFTALGEPIDKGKRMEGNPEHYEFAKKWVAVADDLLAQGKIKVHPPKVMDGGLNGITNGFDLLRNDKVSGQKLVYRVS